MRTYHLVHTKLDKVSPCCRRRGQRQQALSVPKGAIKTRTQPAFLKANPRACGHLFVSRTCGLPNPTSLKPTIPPLIKRNEANVAPSRSSHPGFNYRGSETNKGAFAKALRTKQCMRVGQPFLQGLLPCNGWPLDGAIAGWTPKKVPRIPIKETLQFPF